MSDTIDNKFKEAIKKYQKNPEDICDLEECLKFLYDKLLNHDNFKNFSDEWKRQFVFDADIEIFKILDNNKYVIEPNKSSFNYFIFIAYKTFINRVVKNNEQNSVSNYRKLFDWLDENASELVCETWAIADTGDYDSQWVVYDGYGKERKAIGFGNTPDKAIQDAMKDSEDPKTPELSLSDALIGNDALFAVGAGSCGRTLWPLRLQSLRRRSVDDMGHASRQTTLLLRRDIQIHRDCPLRKVRSSRCCEQVIMKTLQELEDGLAEAKNDLRHAWDSRQIELC